MSLGDDNAGLHSHHHCLAVPGATSTSAPAPPGVYSGNGVFSVGDQPSGPVQHSIPPGRYTVTVTPRRQMGTWIRCSSVVCGLGSPNLLAIENAMSPDYSSVMEIQPTDKAIWVAGSDADQGSVTRRGARVAVKDSATARCGAGSRSKNMRLVHPLGRRYADWLSVAPSTEEAPPLAPGESAGCTVLPGNRNAA
jgi:hypothetical protein